MAARWIKPPRRRENAQRVAHAMFQMSTPETANKLIYDGLYHNMERLRPVKDKKEPMRCLKCQRWGHMAKDCRETSDTCGTCAENHRTNTCTAYKTLRCANCDSKTHGSWSRQCPEFLQCCHDLNTHTPRTKCHTSPPMKPGHRFSAHPMPQVTSSPLGPPPIPGRQQQTNTADKWS